MDATGGGRDALIDRIWDAIDAGDYATARATAEQALAADPGDETLLGIVEMIDALALEPPRGGPEAGSIQSLGERDPLPFLCVGCGNRVTYIRRAMLNTRGLTLLGVEELNDDAACHICTACGLVHWFVYGSPGGYQRLHPDRRGKTEIGDEAFGGCLVCGFDRCYSRSALFNTIGLTLLGLDFLNAEGHALVCVRCGFLHWNGARGENWAVPRSARGPPDPPLTPGEAAQARDTCFVCGGTGHEMRRAMLNSRGLTRFGLEFANPEAEVRTCTTCRSAHWYVPLAPFRALR